MRNEYAERVKTHARPYTFPVLPELTLPGNDAAAVSPMQESVNPADFGDAAAVAEPSLDNPVTQAELRAILDEMRRDQKRECIEKALICLQSALNRHDDRDDARRDVYLALVTECLERVRV